MGVKILVHIHHIRGQTFDVEVDRDAECIGLKLVIWEIAKIAVETQRLVYGGKEIADDTNLVTLGIDDGSTIFLVERVENEVENQPVNPVISSHVVEPMPVREESISMESGPVYQPMSVSSQVPYDRSREERIQSTVELVFWVKVYCVFGILVGIIAMIGICWGSLLPLMCYVIGYIGCKKLNRCCLVFPLLLSFIVGPVGFVFVLWHLATHFWPPMIGLLLVSFLHILVMASIMKLRCRIKHLSNEEKAEAVFQSNANTKGWCF